jgi:membrane-associated PAP2 superfamily phosphatase
MRHSRRFPAPLAYLWSALLGFCFLVGLDVFVGYDLAISTVFYHPTLTPPWPLENTAPWVWLYRYGEYPALLTAIASGCLCLGSLRWQTWGRYRRLALFLLLAITLGPGLLVNGLLKPTWGRPRPRHIELFGGSRPYRSWWQPGGAAQGKSFPSGHAAMGYILVAGICLVPTSQGPWLHLLGLGAALGYGTMLGYARVLQGGHFASDVFAAGGLMCGTVIVLYVFLPPDCPASEHKPP